MNRRTLNFRRRGNSYYQTNGVNGDMEMATRGKDNTRKQQKRRRRWFFPLSILVSFGIVNCIYFMHHAYTKWSDERQIQEVLTLMGEDPAAKRQFGLISCIG